jgi:isoamylase
MLRPHVATVETAGLKSRRLRWSLVAILLILFLTAPRDVAHATAAWMWHGGNIVAGGSATNTVLPGQAVTVWLKVGYNGYVNQARIYYTTNGTEPHGAYNSAGNGAIVAMSFSHTESEPGGAVAWYRGDIPAQAQGTQVRYKIAAWHSGGGDIIYAESPAGKLLNNSNEATAFGYYVGAYTTPDWVHDAVIYQVFIDRFFDGNTANNSDCETTTGGYCVDDIYKWNGGDIAGAIARLDYLQYLGVNTLWLSPVYENPPTQIGSEYNGTPEIIYNYHAYEALDFFDVEDNFGNTGDVAALVTAAQNAGMKVILDFVPNHSSNQHPYFKDASDNCQASPYYRWYKFGPVDSKGNLLHYDPGLCVSGHNQWWGDNDSYANFFNVKEMPQVDNDYGPARQATIDQALYWINQFGFDGLRLDYAPGPSQSFWMAFRAAVKSVDPDIFLVGEVWTDGGAAERKIYEGTLDGVLAFDHYYLYDGFFARRNMSVDDFDGSLNYFAGYYDSRYLLPSFLDNHDTDRFLFQAGQDKNRLKLAFLAQMTLPEPPVVYYGTEAGLSQNQANAGKPERSRSRMPWASYLSTPPPGWNSAQDTDMREYVRTLIDLRHSYSALRQGQRVTLHRHNANATYAYRRTDGNGSVLVAFNNSNSSRTLTIPNLPGVSLGWANGTVVENKLTGQTYTVSNGQISVSLPASQGAVMAPVGGTGPETIDVTFTVSGYTTQWGEAIYVVGSAPELGNWNPATAVPLNWVNGNTWSGPVSFTTSKGTTVEYKYIVRQGGNTTWESGSNRSCAVPASGSAGATDTWNQTPGNGCAAAAGPDAALGATIVAGGVEFGLYSANASRVELSIFANPDAGTPVSTHTLTRNPATNVWSVTVPGLGAGAYYGYRVWGPNWQYTAAWTPGTAKASDPGFVAHVDAAGNRFNPNKLLTDPYARAVTGEFARVWDAADNAYHYHPSLWGGTDTNAFLDSAPYAPKSIVVDNSFNWSGVTRPHTPLSDTVVYEVHLRGYTRGDETLAYNLRGTYAGFAQRAAHLKELGVTAVELLPIHEYPQFDDPIRSHGATEDRVNYWGYMTTQFFAPNREYLCVDFSACPYAGGEQVAAFKELVRALHAEGIEVWLDVVYNHTAEGGVGSDGQVKYFNLRGIDNQTYYTLDNDRSHYWDTTGTGNNINAGRPAVRQMILDSLTYWIDEMRVDGFRFDLAYTLGREGNDGRDFNPNAHTLLAIAALGQEKNVKMVAEAWDTAGYGVGSFPGGWLEWNGISRDSVRRFVRSDAGQVSGLATAVVVGAPGFSNPLQSINFITAHDGFTLNDLVSYNSKQNGVGPCNPGGADPNSGSDGNNSWDHDGDETVRRRQIRNFAGHLFTYQGVPMIVAGDEFRRTQFGNNNGYMADNPCGWLDWSYKSTYSDTFDFFSKMIAFRRAHPALTRSAPFTGQDNDGDGYKDLTWHGVQPDQPDWSSSSRTLAFLLDGSAVETGAAADAPDVYVAYNAYWGDLAFTLPAAPNGKSWYLLADTASWGESYGNIHYNPAISDWNAQPLPSINSNQYTLQARSTLILLARPESAAGPVTFTVWDFENATRSASLDLSGNAAASAGSGLGGESFTAGNPGGTAGKAWSFTHWSLAGSPDAGKYVEFKVDLTAYENLSLSFGERRSSTGPGTFEIHYSSDGNSFVQIPQTVTGLPGNTNWRSHAFDLSSLNPQIAGRAAVFFRIYAYNATGSTGTWRLDDVTFVGEASAPPPAAPIEFSGWNFEDQTRNASVDLTGNAAAAPGSGLGGESFTAGNPSGSSGRAWSFTHWSLASSPGAAKYVEFRVNMSHYGNLNLTFAERRSTTGPRTFVVHYSTDGVNFTPIPETLTALPANTSWRAHSFDLSGLNGQISGRSSVYFRIYGYNASGDTGTWRLDDVSFVGQ